MNKWVTSVIIFSTVLISCKTPFSTREPEEPNKKQSTWIQPTSPNYVLANLRNAIAEKNPTNYVRCFADTSNNTVQRFRFIAEPSVANANPGLFEQWHNEEESNFINQLFFFLPKDSTSQLTLNTLREDSQQDSVTIFQDYKLVVNYDCSETECLQQVEGQVEFRMIRNEEDLWYIHRWYDYATGDEPTWSQLKVILGR